MQHSYFTVIFITRLMPPPRSQFSERHMSTTYIANQPSVGSRTPNKSPITQLSAGDTGSYRPVVRSDAYSVGIQVPDLQRLSGSSFYQHHFS